MNDYNIVNTVVMADPHGDIRPFKAFYKMNKDVLDDEAIKNNRTAIIVAGDFGANYFFNKRDTQYKEALQSLPFVYYVVRGNHEERASKAAAKMDAGTKSAEECKWEFHYDPFVNGWVWVEKNYPRIRYFLDHGGLYKINGLFTLIVPGAYSVDKDYRLKQGWSWFEGEQLTEDERANLTKSLEGWVERMMKPDIVIAHTCPACCLPFIQDAFLSQVDQSTVDNTMEMFLNGILEVAKPDIFYCGHYHIERDIPQYRTTFLYHNPVPFGLTIAGLHRLAFEGEILQ